MEEYRKINGFENYEVSNLGNVRNVETGRILKIGSNLGYKNVGLRSNNKRYTVFIHRLIAKAFLPNPDNREQVDHIDNDRANNNINNLRWCTNQENQFNKNIPSNNTTGFKGVTFRRNTQKWCARIAFNKKTICIGNYDTIEEAKVARQKKANEIFGVFTNHIEKIKSELELLEEELNNL
jgi:hypothetical protein